MIKRLIELGLIAYFIVSLLMISAYAYYWYASKTDDTQPIAFKHQLHLAKVGMSCDFCHLYVKRSKKATVPPVQKCMECHTKIAADRPEIKKLTTYWNNKEPIPWVCIYQLPDYVYFSHKRHIFRKIDCSNCHGEVKYMDKMQKVRSLKMGWCVSCHQQNNAPLDCVTCHK